MCAAANSRQPATHRHLSRLMATRSRPPANGDYYRVRPDRPREMLRHPNAIEAEPRGAQPPRSRPASRRSRGALQPFDKGHVFALIAIVLVAGILRIYGLGEWSFWVDEAHTYRDVRLPLDEFWQSPLSRYPLSFLMLRQLIDDWLPPGDLEALRLPFAFFGIVTVPLLALVGARLVGRRAGLTAAALLAVHPWHIYWSQNARSYSMTCFFAVLAVGCWVAGSARRSWILRICGLLAVALAGFCHPTGWIVGVALLIWTLIARMSMNAAPGRGSRRVVVTVTLSMLCLISTPWLIEHVPPLAEYARAKPGGSPMHLVQTFLWHLRVPLVVAAGLFLLMILHWREERGLLMFCWVCVPALLLFMLSVSDVQMTARYGLYILPALCLLAGSFLVRAGQTLHDSVTVDSRFRRAVAGLILPGIIFGGLLADDYFYFSHSYGYRARWAEASEFLEREFGKDRGFVVTTNRPSLEFYLDRTSFDVSAIDRNPRVAFMGLEDWELERYGGPAAFMKHWRATARAQSRSFYAVVTEPELDHFDKSGVIDDLLRTEAHQVLRLPNAVGPKDLTIMVYRFND